MILRLDYGTSQKPFPWVGAVLLGLAAGAVALSAVTYYHTVEQAEYWEERTSQIQGGSSGNTAQDPQDIKETALEIRHANAVLAQLTIPWDSVFRAVEWSSDSNIALLTIEPDAEKHQLRIRGEAKNLKALWDYMAHLAGQGAFSRVVLRSHQVERRELENPVRFALIVEWRGAQ